MKAAFLSNRKGRLAFGSAMLFLLVAGALSYRGIVLAGEGSRWVQHTHEVLENLQDLLFAMESVESNVRGFVVTGEESYLESYRASTLSAERYQATVRNLTVDSPDQQRRLSALERLAAQKIQFAETVSDLRRVKGPDAAADAIRSGSGTRSMDQFQAVVRQVKDEELRLLAQRSADAKRRLGQTEAVLVLGTVLGLVITAAAGWNVRRDGSRRGRAEEALGESEERYRMLLDGVQDSAIFMIDPRGRIVSWNAGAERIKGYTADEILGRNFSCFFPPEDVERGRPEEVLRMTAASGWHEEHAMRVRKDGSRFLARVTFRALLDAAGNLQGFSEFSHDLSESKESGAKYRGLLEAAPDAMVVVDEGGEIVLLNLQAEKQFGYHRDELVGQPVKNIIPEGFAERLIADARRSTAHAPAEQMGTGRELIGRRRDGSEFPIEIMLSPLESAEGVLVTAAIRDITARRELEQELRHAQRMEGVGQLAGGIAHDFNNLLTVIGGRAQLGLARLSASDPLRHDLDIIHRTAERAALLTRQLLAFSRKQVLQLRVVDLNERVRSSADLLERIIGEHIELIFVSASDTGSVRIDPGQLEQVIVNLAVNARDAMPDGGRITIETAGVELDADYAARRIDVVLGAYAVLSVTDTGVGMSRETQARIFEPFFTTKGPGKGTGLGLATVYGIVKQSGGHIRVYSEVGVGTSFKVYLPCTDEPVEREPSRSAAELPRGTETILLVEDEAEVRGVAHEILERLGYTVLEASVPADAMLIVQRHVGIIDLLLTDVIMPRTSGRVLAETITTERPETKVLFMSGYTDDAIVRHGVLEADTHFIEKPFTAPTLATKVREVLDRPH